MLYREPEDLYEFLVPENLKHQLPHNQRAAKGTFDRKRAIRDASIPLLPFGHPAVDLILRAALAPDSDGGAAVAQQASAETSPLAAVSVLLRQEEHAGSSAYRLLTVQCAADYTCSFLDVGYPDGLKPTTGEPAARDSSAIKTAVIDFLCQHLPEIDFLADKLHWLSVCHLQPGDASPLGQ